MSYEPFDSNGNSLGLPREACCHCGGGFVLECETTPHNWKDSYGDGCEWYELYDEPGCPNYGEYYDGGMGKPNQACCYCEGGSVSNPFPKNLIQTIMLLIASCRSFRIPCPLLVHGQTLKSLSF